MKQKIANGQEDAFHILNLKNVQDRVKIWKHLIPRVQPFYACKANFDLEICKVINNNNGGFDVASAQEMHKLTDMGVEPNNMI